VFKNRVLRRIFGLRRDEVTRGWGKVYQEVVHNLFPSPNIIRLLKSRGMRWVGNVALKREKRNAKRFGAKSK
jgi:hypothetical protein